MVVAAMGRHTDDVEVQQCGGGALRSIAAGDAACKQALLSAGGLAALKTADTAHFSCKETVRAAEEHLGDLGVELVYESCANTYTLRIVCAHRCLSHTLDVPGILLHAANNVLCMQRPLEPRDRGWVGHGGALHTVIRSVGCCHRASVSHET